MSVAQPTILCLASYFKGMGFLEAAKAAGARVLLLTRQNLADEAWPQESLDDFMLMPDLRKQPDITYAVSYLARQEQIDQIIPLDDYDVETVADLREHLRLPGMGASQARFFRDKLAMRTQARLRGIRVPDFCPIFNYDALREFMGRVPPPWVLKPRSEAGAMGIRKMQDSEMFWRRLDELGDEQSYFLLEAFVPGHIFHVDSVVADGEVVFAAAHQYARPPMQVSHEGGVFITRTLNRHSEAWAELTDLNRRLISAFGLVDGVTHAEFIRADADGQLYFLEIAARVGGAYTDILVEAASNVNPWTEWARLEVSRLRGEAYQLPALRQDYAATVLCLAKQQHPNLSAYDAPEVVYRTDKEHHAGLILAGSDVERLQHLSDEYGQRFAEDFLAYVPPLDKAPI